MVVDEESAVLGLPGQRETRLKLDADHSQMCKVGTRGPMYKLIKGNIKQIADQVLVAEQGYIPQPSPASRPPPVPPRMHLNSSASYPPSRSPVPVQRVTGTLFAPLDNDPRTIQAAEHKNKWQWDKARDLEYAIFQEHLRTLGPDHHSTLQVGYNLAEIDLRSECLSKATEWCEWVSNNSARVFDRRHPLAMRAESLMGEILCHQGKNQEGESVCANILARQQMTIGEDNLDTLETRRRLAVAYVCLGRKEEAVSVAEKRTTSLQRLLGENHIQVFASVLCTAELVVSNYMQNDATRLAARFDPKTEETSKGVAKFSRELHNILGPRHPLTIWGLRILGASQMNASNSITEPSETLRRALTNAEEYLGHDHPETLNIVALLGTMYAMQGSLGLAAYSNNGSNAELAIPWLQRYLDWAEPRLGSGNPDVHASLSVLGTMYMSKQQYSEAQRYFERLVTACEESNTQLPQNVLNMIEICRLNTRYLQPSRSSGLHGLLKSFQR